MKILITGAKGQLGYDTAKVMTHAGHEVLACDRQELDITDLDSCHRVVGQFRPDAIIHCAAYTAVDAAESDVDGAYTVNASGTRNMAVAGERVGSKLVYISTDYVFDGCASQPYREYDNTSPQTVYGQSKRAGEVLVQGLSSKWFIVRTSWVFGVNGNNFVHTMLKLGQEKPLLQVVHDQIGSPTYTADLAQFITRLIETEKYGIYHASNSGACSWYEFTQGILEEAADILGIEVTARLEPCTTEQFPRPAPRPANSVLDHGSIRSNGFSDLRPWREALRDFLFELKDN
ncbi:dTDP-4-dehydrorhamnose reductase [Paenibacillus sp. JX-17]|uniref:dTDP-4-dehydrorhamnose reductase n=1 Tax=Paenibacillus lacisoli TaxID=3064525 RepID=A0ABT9CHU7_9BACL|nr:dTDP-4-dehydrorhamnose reductase [Paenibacillus sp. JX-17]MDO7908856.1 dTDP-4-dehydrorhamnose reductase [Paenibacillus sp. JX-17]